MSLDATSSRFENTKTKRPGRRAFRGTVQTQQHNWNERVLDSDKHQAIREREKWNEKLDETWWRKRVTRENRLMQEEISLANKELVLIRRTQMKDLYKNEFVNYEKELNQSQKTFYAKRT